MYIYQLERVPILVLLDAFSASLFLQSPPIMIWADFASKGPCCKRRVECEARSTIRTRVVNTY